MITRKHFAAALGFAFAAAWIAFDLGSAVLCLVGAAAFYYVASYLEGEVDLGDLQARFGPGLGDRASAPAPRSARPRVQ